MPLEVRHNGNHEIEFWTDSIQRVELNPTESYVVNSSFGAKTANGWMLLSPDIANFLSGANGPYSLLHLAAATNNAQTSSDRPWMNVGMTLTGNSDHSYVGQKANASDKTDMVIHWSDNPATWYGPDRLRFLFTSGYSSSSASGAYSEEGLEGMRLCPVTPDEVNVGIGDFYAANLSDPTITEPEERVDVVDGRVRIRQLPNEAVMDTADKYVVVNEDGVLGWQNIAALPDNCEWTMGANPNPNHLWTAVGASDPDCPDGEDNVGIGTNSPAGGTKLNVIENTPHSGLSNRGIFVRTEIPTGTNGAGASCIGVRAEAANGEDRNVGIQGTAFTPSGVTSVDNYGMEGFANPSGEVGQNRALSLDASVASGGVVDENRGVFSRATDNAASAENWGGQFEAYGTGTSATNRGVETYVQGTGSSQNNIGVRTYVYSTGSSSTNHGVWSRVDGATSSTNIAVYGQVGDTLTNHWAGYFAGRVQVTGSMWNNGTFIFSDADIKTNVEDIEGPDAADLLGQLAPRTYTYQSAQYPRLYLPSGQQYGFMAQEVAQVIPAVVSSTKVPAELDSLGNVVHPEMDVEGINYTAMIPLLVAAFKEQQTTISTLQDQLAAVQQDLASCCAAHGSTDGRSMSPGAGAGARLRQGFGDANAGAGEALRTDLFIVPNPVADHTQLRYTVATPGRTRLEVSDASGKRLEVLEEAVREAGAYTHDWTTTDLAPGTYHVTLYLDDSFVVKKAVKVAR
ncbi:MAG: tail fiber domain-containing protein [Flavobacteriales bacterium]|nr:tail fiber domain-containing protein [Flavobacteriales bacterium]